MSPHILVIEDAPEVVALYKDVLRGEGYRVTLLAQVPTDRADIERVHPDLLVLDYLFGGQPHGGQLIRALKARPTTHDLPILVCTGALRTVQAELPYFHMAGIGLLHKPFDLEALLAGVRELLGEPRMDGQTVIVPPPDLPAARDVGRAVNDGPRSRGQ